MKYIKLYEEMKYNVEFEYNIDEYITLKEHDNWVINITAKIKDRGSWNDIKEADYYIETFNLRLKKIVKFWVNESEIERRATPEEIEDFKLKISTIKYNI